MMLGRSFLSDESNDEVIAGLIRSTRQLNKQKLRLNREKVVMRKQQLSSRKQRTRTLIQLGGLVQKSGLLELLEITPGDDLQDYENIYKASQMLGFLVKNLEQVDEASDDWKRIGENLLR